MVVVGNESNLGAPLTSWASDDAVVHLQEHWCDRTYCSTRFGMLVYPCSLRQGQQHNTKTERACHQIKKAFLSVPKKLSCSIVAEPGITSIFVDQVMRLHGVADGSVRLGTNCGSMFAPVIVLPEKGPSDFRLSSK